MVTLGSGIGGGIIARGRIIRGAHGFAAEVGHFQIDPNGPMCACGERGHWEAFASGHTLGRMGREWAAAGRAPGVLARAGGDAAAVTGVHVGDSAQAGEADGRALIDEYASLVAVGLAGLANILDPERIVISGGLVELGDTLLTPVRDAFSRRIEGTEYRPRIDIVPAVLGEQAGVIGAAPRTRSGTRRVGRVDEVKLGVTIPNFREEPEPALAVAHAAEAAGLDGVFGFDHLFRRARRRCAASRARGVDPARRGRGRDHARSRSAPSSRGRRCGRPPRSPPRSTRSPASLPTG